MKKLRGLFICEKIWFKGMKSRIDPTKSGISLRTLVCCFFLSSGVLAQSTNQSYPTPVTTNEISGTVKARDLGDARLTSYFYVFNGNQGDIFINVVTKNLDGDIDIFTADNLRPLTKITVYSDNPDNETGRVLYLRQPQKLILRVEGKSPTDQPAAFRIKFAGSFEAITGAIAETDETKQPEVKTDEQGEVRVNSVGTIIEVKPKPKPAPKTAAAKVEKREPKKADEKKDVETVEKTEPEDLAKKEESKAAKDDDTKEDKKFEVVVTDNLPLKKVDPKTETDANVVEKKDPQRKNNTANKRIRPKQPKTPSTLKTKPKTMPGKTEVIVEPNQLENIRLVVIFKDGTKIERPMSQILKVSVDKGILTVISNDGTIGRYSILDVAKMTIE